MHLDYGVVREHTNSVLLYVEFFGIRVVRVLVCMKEKRRRKVWIELLWDVEQGISPLVNSANCAMGMRRVYEANVVCRRRIVFPAKVRGCVRMCENELKRE